jgi:hypothetical protein
MTPAWARPVKRKADEHDTELTGRQVKQVKDAGVRGDSKGTIQTAPASGRVAGREFISVGQDEPCHCIPRKGSQAGLYSEGFGCCTAIILQSEDAIGLMHTSISPPHLDLPIKAAMARFKALSALPPTITLGFNHGAILEGLSAGEAWEDHHDEELAGLDRERYVKDNMERFLSDIAEVSSSFGARLIDLVEGRVWVSVAGPVFGGQPASGYFEARAPE